MKPVYDSSLDKSYGFYGSQGKNEIDINILTLSEKQYYLEFTPVDPIYDSEGHDISNSYLNNGFYLNFFSFNSRDVLLNEFPAQIYLRPWTFTPIKFCLVDDGGVIERGTFRLIIKIGGLSDTSKPLPLIKMYEDDGAIVVVDDIVKKLPSELARQFDKLYGIYADDLVPRQTVAYENLATFYTTCRNKDRYVTSGSGSSKIDTGLYREVRYSDVEYPIIKSIYIATEGIDGSKGDSYDINNGEYTYLNDLLCKANLMNTVSSFQIVCQAPLDDSSGDDQTQSKAFQPSIGTCSSVISDKLWLSTPHNDHEWSSTDKTIQSKYNPHEFRIIDGTSIPCKITLIRTISAVEFDTFTYPTITTYNMTYNPNASTKVVRGSQISTYKRSAITIKKTTVRDALGNNLDARIYTFVFNIKLSNNTYITINESEDVDLSDNIIMDDKLAIDFNTYSSFLFDRYFTVSSTGLDGTTRARRVLMFPLELGGLSYEPGKRSSRLEDNNGTFKDLYHDNNDIKVSLSVFWHQDGQNVPIVYEESKSIFKIPYNNTIYRPIMRHPSMEEWNYIVQRKDSIGPLFCYVYIDRDQSYVDQANLVYSKYIEINNEEYSFNGINRFSAAVAATLPSGNTYTLPEIMKATKYVFDDAAKFLLTDESGYTKMSTYKEAWNTIDSRNINYLDKGNYVILLPDNWLSLVNTYCNIMWSDSSTRATNKALIFDSMVRGKITVTNMDQQPINPDTYLMHWLQCGAIILGYHGYTYASASYRNSLTYVHAGVAGSGFEQSTVKTAFLSDGVNKVLYSADPEYGVGLGAIYLSKHSSNQYGDQAIQDYILPNITNNNLSTLHKEADYSGLKIKYTTADNLRIITKYCGQASPYGAYLGKVWDPVNHQGYYDTYQEQDSSYHENYISSSGSGFLRVSHSFNSVMPNMFEDSNVKTIVFPALNSLIIYDEAFKDCKSLTTITINTTYKNVNLQSNVFKGCKQQITIKLKDYGKVPGVISWNSDWTGGANVNIVGF